MKLVFLQRTNGRQVVGPSHRVHKVPLPYVSYQEFGKRIREIRHRDDLTLSLFELQ